MSDLSLDRRDRGAVAVGLFLVPEFPLMPLASAIEAMRAANRWAGRKAFHWTTLSREPGPIRSSSGLEVSPTHSLAREQCFDIVLVVSGDGWENYRDPQVIDWLRWQARRGTQVGGVSLGAYLLAHAGLLDGYRCTVHWENLAGFAERFPKAEVTEDVYEIDRGRLTCSGGTAVLDLMLEIITKELGRDVAIQVAEQFMHERIRDDQDSQRMALRTRLDVSHPRLIAVAELMERHIEAPLSQFDLAGRAGITPRQLERLFHHHLKTTPKRYYLGLRLKRARGLLLQTAMLVAEVAEACGFSSASHFAKAYHDHFGRSPSAERSVRTAAQAPAEHHQR